MFILEAVVSSHVAAPVQGFMLNRYNGTTVQLTTIKVQSMSFKSDGAVVILIGSFACKKYYSAKLIGINFAISILFFSGQVLMRQILFIFFYNILLYNTVQI